MVNKYLVNYFTHNNHFKFGWGDELFNFDNKVGDYWIDIGRASYTPTSFRSECVRAARLIYESVKKPILVCFSGGIDSEVIVRSFQEAEVPFEVLIMKLNYKDLKNVNSHDNKYAFDYAGSHQIPINVLEFDLEDFILNKFEREADRYRADYLGLLIHTDIVKHFPNYHCILGGGDIKLYRHRYNGRPNQPGLYTEESEISISAMEAAYEMNNGVSNRFFMHTPELMLSWLLDHDVAHFIENEVAFASNFTQINSHGIKAFAYHRNWPDLMPRPKFNGFEKLTLWMPEKRSENDPAVLEILDRVKEKYKNQSGIIIDYHQLMEKLVPI